MTRRGDIIDQSSVKCRDCGTIVKLNDEVPYETRNWLNHIKSCKIPRFSPNMSTSSATSSSPTLTVDDLKSDSERAVSYSRPIRYKHLQPRDFRLKNYVPAEKLASVRIITEFVHTEQKESVGRCSSGLGSTTASDISEALQSHASLEMERSLRSSTTNATCRSCGQKKGTSSEKSGDSGRNIKVTNVLAPEHTAWTDIDTVEQTTSSKIPSALVIGSTLNSDSEVTEKVSRVVDQPVAADVIADRASSDEHAGLRLLANCVMTLDKRNRGGRDIRENISGSATDFAVPALSSWYPHPLMQYPLLPPSHDLSEKLSEATVRHPLPPSYNPVSNNAEPWFADEEEKQTLPSLPLTVFLTMPIRTKPRRDQMRLAYRKNDCRKNLETQRL